LANDFFIAVQPHEKDRLYVSSNHVGRMSADGAIRWQVEHGKAGWPISGGMLKIAGGDVLVHVYTGGRAINRGAMADGPLLLRVRPSDGHVVWEQDCALRGIGHSFYAKDARIEIRGEWVYIISVEGMASFVEVKLLSTGETIRHWLL
jgi:hypothetical protein